MHPKDWHFSWNNLAIGFFLRCNKFRRQSGIWRKKNLWRCHNSINWAIIWQWSRFGGNGWREFSSDSKTEFGAVLHSSLTPEKYWLFVSLQFVYILCLFCPDFVFLMVCKRRSYFAMVPVKEVDCISPPPLHLVPLPSFIKMLKFSYIL